MADAVNIAVEARDPAKNKGTGSRVARKLRAQGKIPAIVYGHKQDPMPIAIPRETVWQMIKKSTHLAQLQVDGTSEMVIVRDIQWDHLGKEILHMDFARVSADEMISTEVPLELHGTAPGVSEGGVLEFIIHALAIQCRATAIPDSIRIEIGDLHLDQTIHVSDLKLPEGVTAETDADLALVHVITPRAATEETTEESGSEPEVIGRKPEEDAKEEK